MLPVIQGLNGRPLSDIERNSIYKDDVYMRES
jgi:hypothetical protein